MKQGWMGTRHTLRAVSPLTAPGAPGFFHDFTVRDLIERRAACRELAKRMIFLPHQEGAKGECFANTRFVEFAFLQGVASEIRIGEGTAADAEKPHSVVGYIVRTRIQSILL